MNIYPVTKNTFLQKFKNYLFKSDNFLNFDIN